MVAVLLIPVVMSVSAPAELPVAADPFRDALVESIHNFAADGKLAHLQAILDKYPKLLDAKRAPLEPKPSFSDGLTPLQTAARHGRAEVVAFLIKKGANLNVADDCGYTPLHWAAEGGHLDIVKQLVKAGAKVDAKTRAFPTEAISEDAFGPPEKYDPIPARTALQIAEDLKRTAVMEFLKSLK
jgi:ankyrin repeat protein